MTEALLIFFFAMLFANVVLSIVYSKKGKEKDHFFTRLYERYQDRYVYAVGAGVAVVFILSLIFWKALVWKLILAAVDVVFGYFLYLDHVKKKWEGSK